MPERRKLKTILLTTIPEIYIFERISSLLKLKRMFAYCLRFIKSCTTHKQNKFTGNLTPAELEDSLIKLKIVHRQSFSFEINDLQNSHAVFFRRKRGDSSGR